MSDTTGFHMRPTPCASCKWAQGWSGDVPDPSDVTARCAHPAVMEERARRLAVPLPLRTPDVSDLIILRTASHTARCEAREALIVDGTIHG